MRSLLALSRFDEPIPYMPLSLNDVLPTQTETAPSAPPPPPVADGGETVETTFMKFPTLAALLAGTPPAILVKDKDRDRYPEIAFADANSDQLQSFGIGFFSPKAGESILFNQRVISPDEIEKAAKGKKEGLAELAVPLAVLHASLRTPTAPIAPGLNVGALSEPPASQLPSGSLPVLPAPASASTSRKLASARLANVALGSPTSGPAPGQGRVLNNILKPTI